MTAPSATSKGLLEKDDTVNTDDTEKSGTLDTDSHPPFDASETSLQQTVQADGWSSLKDPENPRNWPSAKKAYHSTIPSIFCFTVYVNDTPVTWPS